MVKKIFLAICVVSFAAQVNASNRRGIHVVRKVGASGIGRIHVVRKVGASGIHGTRKVKAKELIASGINLNTDVVTVNERLWRELGRVKLERDEDIARASLERDKAMGVARDANRRLALAEAMLARVQEENAALIALARATGLEIPKH